MHSLGNVLRRESPATLAREALWRAQKRWNRRRLLERLREPGCPVVFRPAGYYSPRPEALRENAQQSLLRYASAITRGEFPWFAYGPVRLGFPPRWNFDFVSGRDWPEAPSDSMVFVRHDGSDVKVPWELSRLQFLPILGKAWRISRDNSFRQAAQELAADWIAKNRVGVGVHWTVAMEAALRAMSLCFLLELLSPFDERESRWIRSVTRSLWEHLLFIEANLEFSHFLRSNHYLSNIAGLFALACYLEGPAMARRRRTYAHKVQKEILHQTYPDGGDFEASMGYHVLCTQIYTASLLLMRAAGLSPASEFPARLEKMYTLLAALTGADGRAPQVGDCDDGRVELLTDDVQQMFESPHERHSLAVGDMLGIGSTLWPGLDAGHGDEACWYGLRAPRRAARPPSAEGVHVFPDSGIACARRGEAEVLFFAMSNGIGGRGSHTHNDKLSVVLRLRGRELFVDSGTGTYTRDAAQRNRFRSTPAHNTLLVDRVEQNRISTSANHLFVLGDQARVTRIQASSSHSLSASVTDRERKISHSRQISLRHEGLVEFEDCVGGAGVHQIDLYFHLARGWNITALESLGQQARCRLMEPIPVEIAWHAPSDVEIIAEPVQHSQAYGETHEAVRLHLTTSAELPVKIRTRIAWSR